MMKMKYRPFVNDGNKTTLDELQHTPTLDFKKYYKCIIIE